MVRENKKRDKDEGSTTKVLVGKETCSKQYQEG